MLKRMIILLVIIAVLTSACIAARKPKKEEMTAKHLMLKSPSGLKARFFKLSGKGQGKTFIERDEIIIATLEHAKPISWHPKMDILLVKEYTGSGDDRCYLLNIGEGEYSKKGKRRYQYVMGDKYSNKAIWSKDGTKVTLYSTMNDKESTYNINEYTIVPEPEEKEEKKEDG